MKTVYKCKRCDSVFNVDFNYCENCLEYDNGEILKVKQQTVTSDIVFDEFTKLAQLIPSYQTGSYTVYLWDDRDTYKKMIEDESLVTYTLIADENRLWVHNGIRWANRIGYLFGRNYVQIDEGIKY